MAIELIPGESRTDRLDGMAGDDGDAVVGFLGDSDALVTEFAKKVVWKLRPFQLLQQEYIRLARLEPSRYVFNPRSN